jgi:hypothetical protein
MTQYVPREQLWAEWDGDLQFDYDHAQYWPALMELCMKRRAERQARWRSGGALVGEFEDYLTGKVDVGAAAGDVREEVSAGPAKAAADDALGLEKLKIDAAEAGGAKSADAPASAVGEKAPEGAADSAPAVATS